ncbi:transcriptional repressor [Coraliomargarita sinensis]|uniref:Transcriptional repressor n=1 Tax=Coraliomargarita sinensis TaxID=2174842 RepID=A0A317ZL86_9BACT|nr:Fur family transcriptional regulator [Coraliomargarita sinensis]PXA04589.1 transcriptional repressor [Coraliomargarita sinensis]
MSQTQTDATTALKEAGLQVTAQRLSVLRCVDTLSHATADSIAESVRGEIGTVSRQAVYDSLAALSEHGLIRRFQPAGSSARYETRTDNHHHLLCRTCGAMLDVDCAKGKAPCLHPVEDHGYKIDEAEVIYWGLCPDCQSQD